MPGAVEFAIDQPAVLGENRIGPGEAGNLGGAALEHDESIAVALFEVEERQPGRVEGDRFFLQQRVTFVER